MGAGTFAVNDRVSFGIALAMALGVAVAGALVEGVAVGGAQWLAAHAAVPELPLRDWVIATSIGAFVAWALGMLPTTLLSRAFAAGATAATTGAPGGEPPLAVQLLLAAGMGIVLGPVLAVPQWRVLRRHVPRAGWWVLANASAWALGMPAVFLATGLINPGDPALRIAALVAAGCLLAGLTVGAVEGTWLVWLLRRAGRLGDRPSVPVA
jgi:hypothetical protein